MDIFTIQLTLLLSILSLFTTVKYNFNNKRLCHFKHIKLLMIQCHMTSYSSILLLLLLIQLLGNVRYHLLLIYDLLSFKKKKTFNRWIEYQMFLTGILIPCILVLVFTMLIIYYLKKASAKRMKQFPGKRLANQIDLVYFKFIVKLYEY